MLSPSHLLSSLFHCATTEPLQHCHNSAQYWPGYQPVLVLLSREGLWGKSELLLSFGSCKTCLGYCQKTLRILHLSSLILVSCWFTTGTSSTSAPLPWVIAIYQISIFCQLSSLKGKTKLKIIFQHCPNFSGHFLEGVSSILYLHGYTYAHNPTTSVHTKHLLKCFIMVSMCVRVCIRTNKTSRHIYFFQL